MFKRIIISMVIFFGVITFAQSETSWIKKKDKNEEELRKLENMMEELEGKIDDLNDMALKDESSIEEHGEKVIALRVLKDQFYLSIRDEIQRVREVAEDKKSRITRKNHTNC